MKILDGLLAIIGLIAMFGIVGEVSGKNLRTAQHNWVEFCPIAELSLEDWYKHRYGLKDKNTITFTDIIDKYDTFTCPITKQQIFGRTDYLLVQWIENMGVNECIYGDAELAKLSEDYEALVRIDCNKWLEDDYDHSAYEEEAAQI